MAKLQFKLNIYSNWRHKSVFTTSTQFKMKALWNVGHKLSVFLPESFQVTALFKAPSRGAFPLSWDFTCFPLSLHSMTRVFSAQLNLKIIKKMKILLCLSIFWWFKEIFVEFCRHFTFTVNGNVCYFCWGLTMRKLRFPSMVSSRFYCVNTTMVFDHSSWLSH